MAERFRLKLSRVIPSLQICHPKDPSASVHAPVPSVYRLSPVNSKAYDISFPNTNNLPAPPPTTPVCHFIKRTRKLSSEWSFRSPEYTWKKEAALCHVAVSKVYDPKHNKKGTIASVSSSRDRGCFSSEEEDESENLISSLTRSSFNYKELDVTAEEVVSPMKASIFRRKIPGAVDGKVRESVAVVKKSVDPYEDFKRSMLEMILKKQMFEAKDLEQLLFCFLSLNSKKYHEIIVEAFSDIWEILFCD